MSVDREPALRAAIHQLLEIARLVLQRLQEVGVDRIGFGFGPRLVLGELHQLVGTVDRWAQRQRYEEAVDEQPLLVHPREVSGIEIPREAGTEIAAGILLNPSADEVRPDRQAIVMQLAQHPIELRLPEIAR